MALDVKELGVALAEQVRSYVKRTVDPMDARLRGLDARLTQLEAAPRVHYEGVHELGKTYEPGALCTRSGSLWYANTRTSDTPNGSADWRLIVKRGRVQEQQR